MSEKNNGEEKELDIKIILVGESGTGKTNLINTYFGKGFNINTESSIDLQNSIKLFEINNTKCMINIWDTMGQEKYRSWTKSFFRETDIVIFVYDITSKKSFTELDYWVNIVIQEIGKEAIFGLAANKNDLYLYEKVKLKDGELYANKINAIFASTSAKSDPLSFRDLIQKLLGKFLKNKNIIKKEKEIFNLNEDKDKEKKKKKKKFC